MVLQLDRVYTQAVPDNLASIVGVMIAGAMPMTIYPPGDSKQQAQPLGGSPNLVSGSYSRSFIYPQTFRFGPTYLSARR
jgi:hypothetical protein